METRKRLKTAKLEPGWRPGRKKRRQHMAAGMIQKCFRSYLLRRAFQTDRSDVKQSFAALRAYRRARDRKYWRTVDLRRLSREELRLAALSLNLPSTGKKTLLICRIQQWVDQHIRMNDLAGEAAARALENYVKGQGAVYFSEAAHDPNPIDIRPLRGKNITNIAAGCESDAVYAIDKTCGAVWLCRTGGHASQVSLCSGKQGKDTNEPALETRWLVNPVFLHALRSEHIIDVQVSGSHAVALAKAGELFAWGENPHGELGFGAVNADGVAKNRPTIVSAIANYQSVSVAVGNHHTIAVCDQVAGHDGVVFSWGSTTYGQLGTSNIGKNNPPTIANNIAMTFPRAFVMHQVESLRTITIRKVACGSLHSMALSSQGKLYTWGSSDGGRLGLGAAKTKQAIWTPTLVRGPLDNLIVLDMACGVWHSACIAAAESTATCGRVFTWGSGVYGQPALSMLMCVKLGAGKCQLLHEPQAIRLPPSVLVDEELVAHISCGMYHSAALTSRNNVFTWGTMRSFNSFPMKLRLADGVPFGKIVSLRCGRTFTVFNTLNRTAESYEKSEAYRLWRVQESVIPKLDLTRIPTLPLSISVYSSGAKGDNNFLPAPPSRLEPKADRDRRLQEEENEAQHIDAIDIEAIVHPLCRVCWRCDGFQPSPLKLWICRHCYHEKQLHGIRPPGALLSEYEAIRKLQCLFRARKAKQLMAKARENHYQRIFSVKHNEFFYYNLWKHKVSWDRPEELRVDFEIPIRDPDELPIINPPLTASEAAVMLQTHWRGYQARKAVKKQLMMCYEKHFDFKSEHVYYLARQPDGRRMLNQLKNRVYEIPALLRRLYDLGEPIEIQRLKKYANMTKDDAARVLQRLYRCFQARQLMKRIIQSRYRKLLDEQSGQYYYYNTITKESKWERPTLFGKIVEESNKYQTKRKTPKQLRAEKFATPNAASCTIQALFRRFQTRKLVLSMLSRRYRKQLDPISGQPYYYDKVAGVSTWIKPLCFRNFDLPVEGVVREYDMAGTTSTLVTHQPLHQHQKSESNPASLSGNQHRSTIVPVPIYHEVAHSTALTSAISVPVSATTPFDSIAAVGPRISEKARRKRQKRRLQRLRQMTRDEAASRLQRMWRTSRAKRELRELLFAAYEKIYDPVTEHFYYYNKKTGVVKWEKPAMLNALDIKETKHIKRRREYPITDKTEATSVIVGFFRRTVARKELYRLLQERIQKVWDPQMKQYYYFDKLTGQSSWNKPVILKDHEL